MRDAEDEQDHVVQFYQTDDYLARVVAPFLGASLLRKGPILVVCTSEHFSAIGRVLAASGLDLEHPDRRELVVWREARTLLERLLIDGEISEAAFQREVGRTVSHLCGRSSAKTLHVFGGLVDLLWATERTAEALLLEDLWHALSEKHRFNLMFSYQVAATRRQRPLQALCAARSPVRQPDKRAKRRVPRMRDQPIADGVRDDLAQSLVGLLMMGESIRDRVPDCLKGQVEELVGTVGGILKTCLTCSRELAPARMQSRPRSTGVALRSRARGG